MRNGENMLIDCGQGGIDFKEGKYSNPSIMDMHKVCDWEEWRKEATYMKIVKNPEEMYTLGGLNKGMFIMQDKMSITFCVQGDDEAVANQVANIPHSDKMRKVIIT